MNEIVTVSQAMIDDFIAAEGRHPQDAVSGIDIKVGDRVTLETIQPEHEGQTAYQRIVKVGEEPQDEPAN